MYMSEDYAIEAINLRREYKQVSGFVKRKKKTIVAVDDVSLCVKKGEIFGLLGENGAGKTTIIKMLITLLAPTSGSCKILGIDCMKKPEEVRKHINFVFGGESGIYRRLSARDNLLYFASLHKIIGKEAQNKADQLLEMVGLKENKNQLVETFSKGMIQRLQIARGLLNDPEILFLDEPTIGLDPVGADILRRLIRKIKEKGRTVLLTTHYMQEADDLCDRITIINHGKIVAVGTSEELKLRYGSKDGKSTLEEVFLELIREKKTYE